MQELKKNKWITPDFSVYDKKNTASGPTLGDEEADATQKAS